MSEIKGRIFDKWHVLDGSKNTESQMDFTV